MAHGIAAARVLPGKGENAGIARARFSRSSEQKKRFTSAAFSAVKQFAEVAQILYQQARSPDMQSQEEVKSRFTSPFTSMGKKELCEALGWSRPRLDRRLAEDADFPVLQRGNRGGGWRFELATVIGHLVATSDLASPVGDADGRRRNLSSEQVRDLHAELARIQAIRRIIETLVAELGVALDRLGASLGHVGLPADSVNAGSVDGQVH